MTQMIDVSTAISNLGVYVSDSSILDVEDFDAHDGTFETCATLEKGTTPNKQLILCDFPHEGQFLTIVKKSKTPTKLTLNEVFPLLLGRVANRYFFHLCCITKFSRQT